MDIAIIGVGSQGFKYAKLIKNEVKEMSIKALVRINDIRMKEFINDDIYITQDINSLFKEIDNKNIHIDSFIITTPHKTHKNIALEAFKRGINVLCEKPLGISVLDAKEMNLSYLENKKIYNNLLYGIIYQQRLLNDYKFIKDIIDTKKYGDILSANIINNSYFRPNSYYTSSSWRAKWDSEGGGLLINQASHSLDIIYYLFSLPSAVYSNISTKVHNIEVEDSADAILKYKSFNLSYNSTTTDPFNRFRLEILFKEALLTKDNNGITLKILDKTYDEYLNETDDMFIKPSYTNEIVNIVPNDNVYKDLFINFSNNITIPGIDGIYSLLLLNSMYLSSFYNKEVTLPKTDIELNKFISEYNIVLNKLINKN